MHELEDARAFLLARVTIVGFRISDSIIRIAFWLLASRSSGELSINATRWPTNETQNTNEPAERQL
jgi:hypothetical protein